MTAGVVIVGGGVAGVSTAAALRAGGYTAEVTLVDAGEFPYDRPPLSKDYLAGRATLTEIALQRPEWYDEHKVRLINRRTVSALRPGTGQVELSDGTTVTADRVVLATGGHALRPPIPGADSDRVHVLRTASDADALRARLRPGARVLVVGAGLIGAEVASTAISLGCEVHVVDPIAPPLAAALGDDIATWLHAQHAAAGIRTEQTGVTALRTDPGRIRVDFASNDDSHDFDLAVLGVGMVPDTTLAQAVRLDTDRGVLVDAARVTSNPSVLAVGDSARVRRDGRPLPRVEHWEAAQRDGQIAAATILGTAPPASSAAWFWTDRHGLHVEAVATMSDAETVIVRGELGTPPFSAFGLVGDRVVAAVAVGDSVAVRAARRLIDREIAVDPSRLGDSSVDLKKLVRG
ncbi:NAD(P)/FAD-dependent oxidoreductase [Nocardia alba]|uniref:NAD/ferredoxin-dependent reductase-like protein n=1 Tax=Nocardia alba TaxID=225051 RepID=A0A4R1FPW4_9NOCA|nr:FAD-dependent oxidoreductase [Nocardia alba]TCJ96653.1 NAD/ferredoxin-dependent reductase-like protein [Nocardia alba]